MKEPLYVNQAPPSTRYRIAATPLEASEAVSVVVTSEVYQPLFPTVPVRWIAVTGGAVSTWIVMECDGSEMPATSTAWKSTGWVPSPTVNGPAYVSQIPPSIWYKTAATPLVASVAVRVTSTAETYHPFCPRVPESVEAVTGGCVSIDRLVEWDVSVKPAASVAKYSTTCWPSERANGLEQSSHAPPSTRQPIVATPLVASVAVSVTVTFEVYHPFDPSCPDTDAAEEGGVVSIPTMRVCVASMSPARSVALNRTVWRPSDRTKGPVYVVHGPPSTWYWMRATPLIPSVAFSVTVTFVTNHPFCPWVPETTAVVAGGVVSTEMAIDWATSTFPARSVV